MPRDYTEGHEYDLDRVTIHTPLGRFDGKGFMRWKPDDGFRIDAFLERLGGPLPPKREYRPQHIVARADTRVIRMRIRNGPYDWAMVPGFPFQNDWDLIEDNRLRISSSRALFGNRGTPGIRYLNWHGEALFEKSGFLRLPVIVERTTIGSHTQISSSRAGFAYKDEQQDVRCIAEDDNYILLQWSLSPHFWSRREAWLWAEAAEVGLSVLYGQTIRLVRRSVDRGCCSFVEWSKRRPIVDLGLLSPCGPHAYHTVSRVIEFINFLVGWGREADVCRRILFQIAEAQRQETDAAQELLLATILEAALRTLEEHPATEKVRNPFVESGLAKFRQRYLSRRWKRYCTRALDAYRRLRHRNAHPDWLTTGAGQDVGAKPTQALDDMVYLARFYGHMMTALAGWKDPTPSFFPPYATWGPSMTVTEPT